VNISIHNYEAFLLDMIEGRLSAGQEQELMRFIEDNPDLDISLDDIIIIPSETADFPLKDDVKKGVTTGKITKGNFDQFCIARLERDLPLSEQARLDAFLIDNPDCAAEAEIYSKLVLRADESVVFHNKEVMKRRRPLFAARQSGRRLIIQAISVAATVALLVLAYMFITEPGINSGFIPLPEGEIAVSPENLFNARPYQENTSIINSPSIPIRAIPEVSDRDGLQPAGRDPVAVRQDLPLKAASPSTGNLRVNSSVAPAVPAPAPVRVNFRSEPHNDEANETQGRTMGRGLLGSLVRRGGQDNDRNALSAVLGMIRSVSPENDPGPGRDRYSLLDFAQAGVKGINSVAGTDLQLEHEYDQNGNLVNLTFSSRIIEFQRSASKPGEVLLSE
jgi:hypothetical protein